MQIGKAAACAALVVVCLFTDAGLARAQAPPPPWTSRDIGSPALSGGAAFASDIFHVDGAGADIWNPRDQFHFVHQPVTGDVDIRARVDSISRVDRWTKAGVMIRSSLDGAAAHGYALVSVAMGTAFQRRPSQGAASTHTAGEPAVAPRWVRLVRAGTTVTAYASADGHAWSVIGSDTIALGQTAYVGLAVTSHEAARRATAVFSNVAVAATALPEGQISGDIGGPAIAGGAVYRDGVYTIHGGGVDIWDSADQFHYVYQPVTGDVEIVARVRSLAAAHRWSKAGVMIRESLAAGSRHAMALTSGGMGHAFQRRTEPSAWSSHTSGGSGAAPVWVRLVRAGMYFEAFWSADGQSWTSMGTEIIAMDDSVYVGLAVVSHAGTRAATAVIDAVRIVATGGPPTSEPPAEDPPTPQPQPDPTPSGDVPRLVAFTVSDDHDTLVTHYVLEIHASGATPGAAPPIAVSDLGKPVPSQAGEVVVDRATVFAALAPGTYVATVTAVGNGESARSEGVSFTR